VMGEAMVVEMGVVVMGDGRHKDTRKTPVETVVEILEVHLGMGSVVEMVEVGLVLGLVVMAAVKYQNRNRLSSHMDKATCNSTKDASCNQRGWK